MSQNRFAKIQAYALYVFCNPIVDLDTKKDPWWPIGYLEKKFNDNRRKFFDKTCTEYLVDKSMSAYCPRTKKTGNLPHLTYCEGKPKNLGTEFKILSDCYSGMSLSVELMKGCFPMRQKKYVKQCGVNGGILLRLTENAMKITQITHCDDIEDVECLNMTTPPKTNPGYDFKKNLLSHRLLIRKRLTNHPQQHHVFMATQHLVQSLRLFLQRICLGAILLEWSRLHIECIPRKKWSSI